MFHSFSPKTEFELDEVPYVVQKRYIDNKIDYVQIESLKTGRVKTYEHDELLQFYSEDRIFFAIKGRGVKPAENGRLTTQVITTCPDDCKPGHWNRAERRLELIKPLLYIDRTEEAINKRIKYVEKKWSEEKRAQLKKVSVRSIYRWIHDYLESGGDIRALIPNYANSGKPSVSHFGVEVEDLIVQAQQDAPAQETYFDLKGRVLLLVKDANEQNNNNPNIVSVATLKTPSVSTVYRRTHKSRDEKKTEQQLGNIRTGIERKQHGTFKKVKFPNTKIQIDGTQSDAILIGDDGLPIGRLDIITALDETTRVLRGEYMGFEPESSLAVLECIYDYMRIKESPCKVWGTENEVRQNYGISKYLAHDHGKGFDNNHIKDPLITLGTTITPAGVLKGEGKAHVESFLATVNPSFWHVNPGTTLSNYLQLGKQNSEKLACTYLSDIDQAWNIWKEDYYHQKNHSGLRGNTPANAWREYLDLGWEPELPPNNRLLNILLGRTIYKLLDAKGIVHRYLRWNNTQSVQLAEFRNEIEYLHRKNKKTPSQTHKDIFGNPLPANVVKLKFHAGDLLMMYAHDYIRNDWIPLVSTYPEYARGLSLWKHEIILVLNKQLFPKVNEENLARAKARIRDIFSQGAPGRPKARFETDGRRSSEFSDSKELGLLRPSDMHSHEEVDSLQSNETLNDEELDARFAANRAAASAWYNNGSKD